MPLPQEWAIIAHSPTMKLKKELNQLDVFCIATGAMLSGLFILPGLAYAQAGPAILGSYFLAAVMAWAGLMSQAELVSAMPKAGGAYFYITRSLGSAVGTVYGLITWFSLALKSAYELVFMAVLMAMFIKINVPVLAVILCLVFLAVNLVGVKEAGKVQVVLVLALLLSLLYFCVRAQPAMDTQNFKPFAPHGMEAVLAQAAFVFISFGGLLKVASIAEEVKNPGKVIPLGMVLSLTVVGFIYLVVIFVTIAVMGENLSGSTSPISQTAEVLMPNRGRVLFSIATIAAIVTSANAGIMTASRYPLALARDEMLPSFFARINDTFKTPHTSILLTGLVVIAAMSVDLAVLVKAASSVLIFTYIFSCLAVVILRESRVQNYQPQFRSVLYPWVQLFGIVGFLAMLYEIGGEALLLSSLLMIVGFLLYWVYGRKKVSREYALLHLIERITAKELTTHALETELKEIVHERDDILKDRFDHLIEYCPVLDVEEAMSMEDFFQTAAQAMSQDLHLDANDLARLFQQREEESSTVLNPFLAIPHIILDGDERFDILLARSKAGFVFSEKAPKVHTVFMLVGTRDERPFHLLSLAAIAQIVQDPDFEKRWMAAKSVEALRDIVLMGKRQRQN